MQIGELFEPLWVFKDPWEFIRLWRHFPSKRTNFRIFWNLCRLSDSNISAIGTQKVSKEAQWTGHWIYNRGFPNIFCLTWTGGHQNFVHYIRNMIYIWCFNLKQSVGRYYSDFQTIKEIKTDHVNNLNSKYYITLQGPHEVAGQGLLALASKRTKIWNIT